MKRWYVLRSKSKQEKLAATVLANVSIETYVPTHAVHRVHGKPPILEPFFPGYLFGHLDRERSEIRLASYTPGIVAVLGYGSEPWPVSDSVVDYVRQRLVHGYGRISADDLHQGDQLLILSGPLRGIEAIFDRYLSATGRVRVLIQILSRQCPAEVRDDQIRRNTIAASLTSG